MRALQTDFRTQEATCEEAVEPLRVTIGNLENNEQRMAYSEYRRRGFPVTTAWMGSLVKEINDRVKGTEMFWENPQGVESILQLRAAALSNDDRLKNDLDDRAGSRYVRRPKIVLEGMQLLTCTLHTGRHSGAPIL